jgi:hypothetical protein
LFERSELFEALAELSERSEKRKEKVLARWEGAARVGANLNGFRIKWAKPSVKK